MVTMSQNVSQPSINNFWSYILDNLTAIERRKPTMNIWQPWLTTMLVMISHLPHTVEHPRLENNFFQRLRTGHCNLLHCAVPTSSFTQWLLAICPFIQIHITACNVLQTWLFCLWLGVSIYEPAVSYTVTLCSVVFRVELPNFHILTTMSDLKSLITYMHEVMNSSKNEHLFVHVLSHLTLPNIFDASLASMNVGS
jgi:hypothetical protein